MSATKEHRTVATGTALGSDRYSLRSRYVQAWVTGLVLAYSLVVRLARYPEWDESVFLSQSGGFEGISSPPSSLVASREIGTPFVLGLLRAVNPTLANVRLLWMALSFLVLVVGIVYIGRTVGFPPILGISVLSTYWLTFSFASSFFSFFMATASMLMATAMYLRLRNEGSGQVVLGFALGFALAACLWFRQIEGALFCSIMALHSVSISPTQFWKRRGKAVVVTFATLVLTFVIPWAVDSSRRFGSVSERISSAQGQSFERGFTNNVLEYLGTLRGASTTYGRLGDPPVWALLVLGILLAVGFASAVAVVFARRAPRSPVSRDGVTVAGLSFIWMVGITFLGFFMMFIGVVTDRYMVAGALFTLLAIVASLWPSCERWLSAGESRHGSGRARRVVATGILAAWAVANATVANTYEAGRFEGGLVMERNVETIRALSRDGPCRGVSRYGAPQVQFGTGCQVQSSADTQDAVRALEATGPEAGFLFLLWPDRAAEEAERELGQTYDSIPLEPVPGGQRKMLFYTRGGSE